MKADKFLSRTLSRYETEAAEGRLRLTRKEWKTLIDVSMGLLDEAVELEKEFNKKLAELTTQPLFDLTLSIEDPDRAATVYEIAEEIRIDVEAGIAPKRDIMLSALFDS